jgi:hypothetical protein
VAHAYTPGLRVTGHTLIDKVRRLPLKGEVVAKKGDTVRAEDIVAKTALPGNVKTVNVANILGIPPADIPGCMLKQPGEPVQDGEPIARAKSLFGLFKSTAKANTTGTLENVSEVTGQVTLREPALPVEMSAYVDGTVKEVMPEEGVVVETGGALIQGIFGIGGEGVGVLQLAVDAPDRQADPAAMKDVKGKVVVVGTQATHALIREARKQGAAAIVAGGIADEDLRKLLGYDLGVAITGHEDLGLTVITTEGFGALTIAHKTFELLSRLNGKKASVNGATQIRAGVLRPEIIVPLEESRGKEDAPNLFQGGLDLGMIIRVIREPYFGRLGKVTELPSELLPLETEAKVRVLKVKFDDGDEVLVPRANVEMIEG